MLAATRTKGIKSWGVSKHDRHQKVWIVPVLCTSHIPGQPGILHFEDLGGN